MQTDEKKKQQMVTVDRSALLAFVYYDTTHCNYINDKELEDMVYTLGLRLSRSQVLRMLNRLVSSPRSSGGSPLHYRKLTDAPAVTPDDNTAPSTTTTTNDALRDTAHQLAAGNPRISPNKWSTLRNMSASFETLLGRLYHV